MIDYPLPGQQELLYVVNPDIGYDIDDAVALPIAARRCPRLVVVTSDETWGRRARLTRHMLDLLDRPDVPVYEGRDLGGDRFLLDEVLPSVPRKSIRPLDDLVGLLEDEAGPIIWIGQGTMGELAHVLTRAPHLAEQIKVNQMGGWFENYRRPDRASHNLDTDRKAANIALRLACRPRLVLSDHTNVDELAIWPESEMTQWMTAPNAEPWARLIGANMTAWWAWQRGRNAPARTRLHDPVTVSAALGEPFVRFAEERIRIIPDARTRRDPLGRPVEVTTSIDCEAAMAWIHDQVYAA
ncbi:nucleoside hydrolase [Nocardia sp. BMG51109]|uniref:nucleoside hydrolase n=1 Tax=Nocardia sp. BMG51109 TaxID=1056816 RepID=UPI0004AF3EFF|nr:nucleoside hydrolase [Nocardia sp. BMG51109]